MNLFYQPNIQEGVLTLDEEESRHAVKVLRMVVNDTLCLSDGRGGMYIGRITQSTFKKCQFEIIEKKTIAAGDYMIHIAIAPTKNLERTEWFVEKATEMGIHEISFIQCHSSERKVIKIDRLEKIAISAIKQSQQAWLPKIHAMVPFQKILSTPADQKFIGFVDGLNQVHLNSLILPKKKYLVLIGPEGDFTKDELATALAHDFNKVSLGLNRLRTETAGLTACQLLHFAQL